VKRESEISQIDALMRKLAQESPREAPQRVRLHIESVAQQYRSPAPLAGKRWLLAAAVLFVALVLTIGAMISKRSGDSGPVLSAHSDPVSKVVAPANVQAPPMLEAQRDIPTVLPPSKAVPQQHQHPKTANPQPVFVRLPFSDPTLAAGTGVTVRLALSEAELLAMGVRPIESNPSESYVADLVLGDDGLPRAIRIVSHGPRIDGGS
jgi:hypothetical protein